MGGIQGLEKCGLMQTFRSQTSNVLGGQAVKIFISLMEKK